VFIPRLGWLPVDDTGGAVGPHQLDVRLPSHVAAAHWGRRRLRVRWKPARR
jgi:3D (Asp-Asp-Asp) domain-containing protein